VPPMICVSIARKGGIKKDTLMNVELTRQFVVNVAPFSMAEKVNGSAAEFPPNISELHQMELKSIPSEMVQPPRVVGCSVQMECKLNQIIELGQSKHSLVIGEILLFHIDDDIYQNGEIKPRMLNPLMRLSGDLYGCIGEILEMKRSS
jgi:flavin reductase (DIM6/NTAB) family NADH-FMN oxidoreductase RutF